MPCATWESGFFVGEEFCAWAEWTGSWASTRPSQEHAAAQREQEAARQREQEAARQREQEAARQREQEEPRQRDPESARQREKEAAGSASKRRRGSGSQSRRARQREQEAARQREQEAAPQREQEAARLVRALGLAQPKPELLLHTDTEWTETASVASSRTTVRHATRTVVCIICGQVGHDANTGCTKGLCFWCKRPGHVAAKCPQARLAEERRRLERSCYACGQPGHFARDCRTSASAQRA
jgi:hypothetical protein